MTVLSFPAARPVRALTTAILIGLLLGLSVSAVMQRTFQPFGRPGAVSSGPLVASAASIAVTGREFVRGTPITGEIRLSLDDGVRRVSQVQVHVLPAGANPRPILAILELTPSSQAGSNLVIPFTWDQRMTDGVQVTPGSYDLFALVSLERESGDERSPFTTALGTISIE